MRIAEYREHGRDAHATWMPQGRSLYAETLANEEFSSQLRVVPFPFTAVDKGTSVEIYHGSHGKYETKSPIRTFAVF